MYDDFRSFNLKSNKQYKKIVIAGGGTGGHIYPGVAIAKTIEKLDKNIEVVFVGSALGLETKIIPREGFSLVLLPAGKLNYSGGFINKIKTFFKLPMAFVKSAYWLIVNRPLFVLGVGGYASGPFVAVASLLKFKTAIWEPNAHPGLTNRWLSKIVNKAYYVFDESAPYFSCRQKQKVGLPVRQELESLEPVAREDNDFHVLVFGGSQGSKYLNDVIEKMVIAEASWLHKGRLIHQTGVNDYSQINEKYKQSVFHVQAYEYLHEMNKYYEWADLVICRSGASTVAELAAVGKPAILIPLPTSADDHQLKNAKAVADQGAAILLEQKNLTGEQLQKIILNLQNDKIKLKNMSEKMKSLHAARAAEEISKNILKEITQ